MQIIEAKFGLNIQSAKSLDGDINYANQKYLLEDHNKVRYILKIFPDNEEWELAQEESLILKQIADQLPFKVPQNIPLPDGKLFFDYESNRAKLLNFIEGDFLTAIEHTPTLMRDLGRKVAIMNKVLLGVKSPILASRKLFWDIQYTQLSKHKIDLIQEPERRKIITYYIDRFTQFVLPIQHTLRHAIIHGDLNDYNILVNQDEIVGFIDFGDATYSPMVNDLAIAMTYLMLDKPSPFEAILPLLQAYHEENPLSRQEVELLPDLITSRLCISLCNSAEKKHLKQDNEYVLISEKPAWALLEQWVKTNPLKIKNLFLKATNFEIENLPDILSQRQAFTTASLGLSYQKPIHMSGGLFQYMFDDEGNTYLDAYNNIPHVGHTHPKVAQAISYQIRHLNTNTRYLYNMFSSYTEQLLKYFPKKLCKVFYVNSGSEANDLAVRIARTYTQRKQIAVLAQGYHGNTSLGIDISSYKFDRKGGKGLPEQILKLPLPNQLNYPEFNGAELAKQAIQLIESASEMPAAFIAEPISGCGGQVPLAKGYLQRLYSYLNQKGVVTIVDEVQTGFGRLGDWFWGFEMHEVIPDIVVLGKPIANGHPMAAVVTTQEIAEAFANGMEFFSSFGGNPVSCQAAQTVLGVIEEENLQENAKTTGEYFKECLQKLQQTYSRLADIRGEGLFLGIEFRDQNHQADPVTAVTVKEALKANFILTGTDGPENNVIKIKPPLCFNQANVDHFIEILDNILKRETIREMQ